MAPSPLHSMKCGVAALRPPLRLFHKQPLFLPSQEINFSLIRPFIRIINQSRSYRIISNIFPFFRISFSPTNLTIPIISLPDRFLGDVIPCASYLVAPKFHPFFQGGLRFIGTAEKMDMIRHDDIAPNRVSIRYAPSGNESLMHGISGKKSTSMGNTNSDKEKYRVVTIIRGKVYQLFSFRQRPSLFHFTCLFFGGVAALRPPSYASFGGASAASPP
jgi:hypothetical protein